jgi:hypothetical protein
VHILTLGNLEATAQVPFVDVDVGRKKYFYNIKSFIIGKMGVGGGTVG